MKLYPERLVVRMDREMLTALIKIGEKEKREPAEIMRAAAQAVIEAYQRDKGVLPRDFEIRQKAVGKQWLETYPEYKDRGRSMLNEIPPMGHGLGEGGQSPGKRAS